jgi:hypothetical protein
MVQPPAADRKKDRHRLAILDSLYMGVMIIEPKAHVIV